MIKKLLLLFVACSLDHCPYDFLKWTICIISYVNLFIGEGAFLMGFLLFPAPAATLDPLNLLIRCLRFFPDSMGFLVRLLNNTFIWFTWEKNVQFQLSSPLWYDNLLFRDWSYTSASRCMLKKMAYFNLHLRNTNNGMPEMGKNNKIVHKIKLYESPLCVDKLNEWGLHLTWLIYTCVNGKQVSI